MLTDEEALLVEALRDARAQKKEWEEQEKRVRQDLLDAIGEADMLYHNERYIADIETRESTRFDRKTFAKDWPKLDEEYRTTTQSKVVNLIGE